MLIVDMPMPRGCAECPLKTFGGACRIPVFGNGVNYKPFEERPDWCPIKGELVTCGECRHYHSEDDPAYCDELCTIHIDKTDGCLRGIIRGAEVGYRAADGERKDGAE